MYLRKLKRLDRLNWIHIIIGVVLVYSIIMTVLATREFALVVCLIAGLEFNVFIFTHFTYSNFAKHLITFRSRSTSSWASYIKYNNYFYDMLEMTSKIMRLYRNIGIISFIIWFIDYTITFGANMNDIIIFIGCMTFSFCVMYSNTIFEQIFSDKDIWCNPKITPLKHIKNMVKW